MDVCDPKMNDQESLVESGIDLGFDLTNFDTVDTDQLLQELGWLDGDSASFYQLKSKPVGGSPPTSLKLATMSTRTNLKQYLQMQQVQEQERKEQEQVKQATLLPSKNTRAVNVPPTTVTAPRMDVPSEVLKVNSRLENPTQFHVIESRKRQVQEYLSTAQGNGRSLLVQSVPNNGGAQGALASAPAVASASLQPLSNSAPSPDSPNSVALSSSATSASEADVIESIIQMESSMDTDSTTFLQTSTMPPDTNFLDIIKNCGVASPASSKSCPSDENVKQEAFRFGDCSLQAIAKDRQKKDNHNMIERRRRFNINDRIKELATLLPKSNDPYFDVVRVERQNKGTILKASVDFIKELRREVDRLTIEAKEKKRLEHENWKLKHQFQQLMNTHQQVTSASSPDITFLLNTTTMTLPKEEEGSLQVKQEPLESLADHHLLSPVSIDDLMEDDRHPVNGDPMLPCPLVNDDVLLNDGMEFTS